MQLTIKPVNKQWWQSTITKTPSTFGAIYGNDIDALNYNDIETINKDTTIDNNIYKYTVDNDAINCKWKQQWCWDHQWKPPTTMPSNIDAIDKYHLQFCLFLILPQQHHWITHIQFYWLLYNQRLKQMFNDAITGSNHQQFNCWKGKTFDCTNIWVSIVWCVRNEVMIFVLDSIIRNARIEACLITVRAMVGGNKVAIIVGDAIPDESISPARWRCQCCHCQHFNFGGESIESSTIFYSIVLSNHLVDLDYWSNFQLLMISLNNSVFSIHMEEIGSPTQFLPSRQATLPKFGNCSAVFDSFLLILNHGLLTSMSWHFTVLWMF